MLQLFLNGLITGSIIALGAIGLSMIYDILGLVNFAHGDFMTFGGYLTFFISLTFLRPISFIPLTYDLLLSAILAIIGVGLFSILLDKIIWKKLRKKGAGTVTLLITAIGIALALRNGIVFIWGSGTISLGIPVSQAIEIFGVKITFFKITSILVAITLMLLLDFLLKNTKIGKAMRALSDNQSLASITGINVDKIISYTWFLGGAYAATGGILYGLITSFRPDMGWILLLPIFAAVILGSIGNVYGAMIGGLIIGLAQETSLAFIGSRYKIAVSFFLLIIVLLFKPEGIFGGK